VEEVGARVVLGPSVGAAGAGTGTGKHNLIGQGKEVCPQ
jgi:hypothetical protein